MDVGSRAYPKSLGTLSSFSVIPPRMAFGVAGPLHEAPSPRVCNPIEAMKAEVFAEAGPDRIRCLKRLYGAQSFAREMPPAQAEICSRFANQAAAGKLR